MKLYYSPGACSLSPHIVAREAGLPLELVRVDLKTHKTADGRDYKRINPRGYVPALELPDGNLLREGPAIVQYLADRAPASGLVPAAGTFERVRAQEWLAFIGTELHKQFHWLFHPAPEATQNAQREKIGTRIAELEQHLAASPYLMGEAFTVADAYAFTVLNWCKSVAIDLAAFPHVIAFMARVSARPKVQEALTAEGLRR
jgi:glutathione S-transferase